MWKRKIGDKLQKVVPKEFSAEDANKIDAEEYNEEEILMQVTHKRMRFPGLEDSASKARRLKLEGTTLAEAERYWEAIKHFDGAIQLTPLDETIHEMKAQAYMQLSEIWPAVSSAEEAVRLNPIWDIGHQTLGRARLGVGDVQLALDSFIKAFHLNPTNMELYEEDLMWAKSLNEQRKQASSKNLESVEKEKASEETSVVIADYYSEEENDVVKSLDHSLDVVKANVKCNEFHSTVKEVEESAVTSPCRSMRDLVKMNLSEQRK